MSKPKRHAIHSFDIDDYLNYIVLRPRWNLLPRPISFWFGYRAPSSDPGKTASPSPSVLLVWLFSFLGGFIGISIIENVFLNLPHLGGYPVPIVIASFGAAAILEYNTIESPLAQPRNLIVGHFLSAAIGVGITKLFRLLPQARFEDLRWLAGALSVGCASTVMGITKTVHPPAGATALLAATTPEMTELGWWLLPLVLLASSLMLASAMVVNNLYKRFPLYWWTPADLSKVGTGEKDIVSVKDVEKGKLETDSQSNMFSDSETEFETIQQAAEPRTQSDPAKARSHDSEILDTSEKKQLRRIHEDPELKIQIEVDRIVVPDWMSLSQWEVDVLEGFQTKLKEATKTR